MDKAQRKPKQLQKNQVVALAPAIHVALVSFCLA
jgi:hypothetical protein